jgi:hypothetical protein
MEKHRSKGSLLLVCLSVMLLAFGCSDDDGGTTNPPPADTDPPQIASVVARSALQIELTYNEAVEKNTAEDHENYTVVEVAAPAPPSAGGGKSGGDIDLAAPGDTLHVNTVAQISSQKVLLTLWNPMGANPYAVSVDGVKDLNGNKITSPVSRTFDGSTTQDQTPPEIVRVTPANGSTVGVGESMVAQFSEPVSLSSAVEAFTFRVGGNLTPVAAYQREANICAFTPVQPMPGGTACTARFSTALEDWAGNNLAAEESWVFNTTSTPDAIRPTLVSTAPVNGATNVPLDGALTLRFSEAIDPLSLEVEEGPGIVLNPEVRGTDNISVDRTTLTFEPYEPLATNTSYTLVVPEGAVRDLAGNPLSGSTTVQFTTGTTFPTGSMSGTVAGDPGTQAANPAGAIVVATTNTPFSDTDDDLRINGAVTVGPTGAYSIMRLPDSWYFPFAIMDSNGDGFLEPDRGDAIGAYGVDILHQDFEVDSVEISGGNSLTGVDTFPLFDPVAIAGTVSYGGSAYQDTLAYVYFYVGVFDTAGFDPDTSSPQYVTYGEGIAYRPRYAISTLGDAGLPPGTYYVGAYMDVEFPDYDPDVDPAGWYGGAQPVPVTVEDGMDRLDIDIELEDPNGSPFLRDWHEPVGTASRDRDARARFRAHINRMVEQLNRQK